MLHLVACGLALHGTTAYLRPIRYVDKSISVVAEVADGKGSINIIPTLRYLVGKGLVPTSRFTADAPQGVEFQWSGNTLRKAIPNPDGSWKISRESVRGSRLKDLRILIDYRISVVLNPQSGIQDSIVIVRLFDFSKSEGNSGAKLP